MCNEGECMFMRSMAKKCSKKRVSNGSSNGLSNESIAKMLGIYDYDSYDSIPPAKLAWVTIKAKKRGKNPIMVHAGIKATFVKRGR